MDVGMGKEEKVRENLHTRLCCDITSDFVDFKLIACSFVLTTSRP